jgi:hypothetical protein
MSNELREYPAAEDRSAEHPLGLFERQPTSPEYRTPETA